MLMLLDYAFLCTETLAACLYFFFYFNLNVKYTFVAFNKISAWIYPISITHCSFCFSHQKLKTLLSNSKNVKTYNCMNVQMVLIKWTYIYIYIHIWWRCNQNKVQMHVHLDEAKWSCELCILTTFCLFVVILSCNE